MSEKTDYKLITSCCKTTDMLTYTDIHIHIHIYAYICVYSHMSAYTDIYIYIHMLTYTTDIYRHTDIGLAEI